MAVTRDPRNADGIRITCRNEDELARVKGVAERAKASGARVLRDQWHPVKVDNACRTALLDENGELRVGVTAMIEKENEVKIAKVSWPSRKDSPKAYGSMVIYVTKRADAVRLLEGQYSQRGRTFSFHPGVETQAWTNAVLQVSGAWP